MSNEREQWLHRIHRYAEGMLPAEELPLLEAELRRDPGLRREFIEYLNLDAALEEQALGFVPERARQPRVVLGNWRLVWRVVGVGAAVVLLGVGALFWLTLRPESGGVPVEITSAVSPPMNSKEKLSAGNRTRLGRLQLASGQLVVRLESDVQLELSSPLDVEFLTPRRVRLHTGQLTAQVGERGRGFTVETARGNVVDLGTRFGVTVTPSGATDVVVFDGHVEVQSRERRQRESELLAKLQAGEGVRLVRPRKAIRLRCLFLKGDEWFTHPPLAAAVQEVRDNVTTEDPRRFYRVWVGGMTPGAQARHIAPPRWFPAEGDAFPEWLEGADVVETFGYDRHDPNLRLTLTLAKPAVVYVFHDVRQPPPHWLQKQFTDTGTRVLMVRVEGGEDSLEEVLTAPTTRPFAVWKSPPLPPGPITLGPRRDPGQPNVGRMYGVAVKALAGAAEL